MNNIISNKEINKKEIEIARKIILELQKDINVFTNEGYGPFVAAICNEDGKIIAKEANSVAKENCSNNHAEINAIKSAQKIFGSYDLSSYNLNIYITAEPCMMCLGAIMWSGIKNVYYGVSSKKVEEIIGFDEGFKPNWFDEFRKRNIGAFGNIETEIGEEELKKYIKSGKVIYKPSR